MRIFAFTDPHGSPAVLDLLAQRVAQAEVVLCAGDVSIFGHRLHETLEAMQTWGKRVYLIHGNHEDLELLEDVEQAYPNITFAHGREIDHEGIKILSWGGGGFARTDPELAAFAADFTPQPNRIFMIHGPPYDTAADSMEHYGHVGCKTRRAVIERLQPMLTICGHIHETFGASSTIGKTTVLNPGPLGVMITIETKPKKTVKKK